MLILGPNDWRPNDRPITFSPRPEWVPEWVYTEAQAAKQFYNAQWEFWVYEVARKENCSQAVAEDACIRGLKKAINRIQFVYGPKIGKWYEDFLEMGSIFDKVKHPTYLPKLGED